MLYRRLYLGEQQKPLPNSFKRSASANEAPHTETQPSAPLLR